MTITPRDLQTALHGYGFDPGPIDGVLGPRTRAALRAFQKAKGLTVDGIAGPLTRAAMFGRLTAAPTQTAVPLDLPWMLEASRLRGTREGQGAANNPSIIDWAADLRIPYRDDAVPWCGLFTAHCMAFGLPDEPLPVNPLGARQWLAFGREVAPQWGAVLVFWRGSRDGWQGHVGFCWAEDATHFHVLGGNQSDAVTVARIDKGRLLGARWPVAVQPPGITRQASAAGLLTTSNEA